MPYRSRACVFSAMDTATGFPPTTLWRPGTPRPASWLASAWRRARPSTATPAATVAKNAANSRPGDRKIRSRCRNATHGPFGSDHPKNPSMYMDTGAMRRYRTASTRNRSVRVGVGRRRRRSPRRTSARQVVAVRLRAAGRPATPRPSRARRTSTPRPRRNRPRSPPHASQQAPRRRRSSSRPPGAAGEHETDASAARSRPEPRRPGTRARRPRATRRRWFPATWGATWRRGAPCARTTRATRAAPRRPARRASARAMACVGTATASAADAPFGGGGAHARAASPSITMSASGGSSGARPSSVSPREPNASSSSEKRSSASSRVTRRRRRRSPKTRGHDDGRRPRRRARVFPAACVREPNASSLDTPTSSTVFRSC